MTNQMKIVEVPTMLTVRELAELIGASPIDVIKQLMSNGIMASINQQIDFDTAAVVIEELGYEAIPLHAEEAKAEQEGEAAVWRRVVSASERPENLVRRPPVVTILGHVDHGKTSLLDAIRHTNVTADEYGGITQHIGAYQVQHNGRTITFLDTPGHEAFTAMRARGAQGADVAVLVVAADDGVMPQTREAIAHVKAARVPIVVAINKVDRPDARVDRVKQQLSELDLVPDDWDGDTLMVPVSATAKTGIDDLLEAILLVADETDISANPDGELVGTVLEGELDRQRGVVATLLVQNGTLRVGDVLVMGGTWGKVRAMFDEKGNRLDAAGPSMPAVVMGLHAVPVAGDLFRLAANEKEARALIDERNRPVEAQAVRRPMTLEDFFARFAGGDARELNLIVKADVQGSLEPIVNSLEKLSDADTKVNILHAEIGEITDSDVMLASASHAIILGFQVDVDHAAQRRADATGVDIRTYNIIYELIEDVELALHGMLEPVFEDVRIGVAEVRQVFRIRRVGRIAGCLVREGEARRNAKVRVVRGGQTLHEGRISSLKRYEEDVREVRAGFECGIGLQNFDDLEAGDILEFYVQERVR